MEKIVLIVSVIVFGFVSVASAEQVCFEKIYTYDPRPGETWDCVGVPHSLILVNSSCTVSNPRGDSCSASYTVCCDSITLKSYVPGSMMIELSQDVSMGDYVQKVTEAFDNLKNNVSPPPCLPGFSSSGGGVYSFSIPSVAASGTLGKVDIETYVIAEDSCMKTSFSNNTAIIVIGGIGSGGGSGSGTGGTVTVDMVATNDLLTAIKAAIEGAGNKGDNTGVIDAINSKGQGTIDAVNGKGQGTIDAVNDKGQGTIDAVNNIKALLDTGGVANPNAILLSIKGVLDGLGTKGTEGNQLLTDIKTILQNGTGGTGGGTGGTATDMTATNNLLTESKGILGSIKDKIDSLYDSITGFFNTGGDSGSVDTLSTAGVPTEGDLTGGDLETRMRSQLKDKFEFEGKKTALDIYKEHQKEWGKSDLFGFINNLNVQMGASLPVWNLSLPRWGVNYTFDLGDSHWSYIFGVVRTLIIIGATIMAYRIIFRAGA